MQKNLIVEHLLQNSFLQSRYVIYNLNLFDTVHLLVEHLSMTNSVKLEKM